MIKLCTKPSVTAKAPCEQEPLGQHTDVCPDVPWRGAGREAGRGGRTPPAPTHTQNGRWRLPAAPSPTPSTSSESRPEVTGTIPGVAGAGCDPPSLSAEALAAPETHLSGQYRQRCRARRGAPESGATGDGPPPGSHHRDTGKEHPALPDPGPGGPGFPGHGRAGARVGSEGGPLPVCPSVHLPQWN